MSFDSTTFDSTTADDTTADSTTSDTFDWFALQQQAHREFGERINAVHD